MIDIPWDVAVLAVILGTNRFVAPAVLRRAAVFWGLQSVLVCAALYVGIEGMHEIDGYPVVSWLIVALLVVHLVQNLAARSAALHRDAMDRAARR